MVEVLQKENYLSERASWQEAFDDILVFASSGILEKEILAAKEIFFSKLGRAHEMKEGLYENASQSFLEWYLFEYETQCFTKSPVLAFLTLRGYQGKDQEKLERALFNHWSIYRVSAVNSYEMILEDLLFMKKRRVLYDSSLPEAKLWKAKEGNLIQARLFPLANEDDPSYFVTHLWIHPRTEEQVIEKICLRRKSLWGRHSDFLLASFAAAVRSYGIQNQITSSGAHNWMYQELQKRYG